jgi:hypothetical protein
MPKYKVTTSSDMIEVYEVEAKNALEAMDIYHHFDPIETEYNEIIVDHCDEIKL